MARNWIIRSDGNGLQTRATPAQADSIWQSPSPLRMRVQPVRKTSVSWTAHLAGSATTATGGRHREADSLSFGIQLAHKRAPRGGGRASQRLKKAEAALLAAQEAGLPQSFIDEFLQEVQSRRQERESRKQIGARRTEPPQQRHEPRHLGRTHALNTSGGGHTGQCTRSGKGASGTGTHRVHEGRQRDRGMDAEFHEYSARRSTVHTRAQSPVGLQEAVTAARATLQQTATGTRNSTHESRSRNARRRYPSAGGSESMRSTDDGSNKDFDDDSGGFTTSSVLATMTGEDFERHFFGTR